MSPCIYSEWWFCMFFTLSQRSLIPVPAGDFQGNELLKLATTRREFSMVTCCAGTLTALSGLTTMLCCYALVSPPWPWWPSSYFPNPFSRIPSNCMMLALCSIHFSEKSNSVFLAFLYSSPAVYLLCQCLNAATHRSSFGTPPHSPSRSAWLHFLPLHPI